MNVYIIIGSIIILIILLIFAIMLHNARVSSTKAIDYFNDLDSRNIEEDNSELEKENKNKNEKVEESDDTDKDIRDEQTAQYLLLLEMHKNNKYKKKMQRNIDDINEDDFNELNDYITLAELSTLLGISTDETISFLISMGYIEREHYTLVLTDRGVDLGGQYNSQEGVTWIEFPKDMLQRLENTHTKDPTIKVKKNKKEAGDNIWFVIIVVALVYFFFFK